MYITLQYPFQSLYIRLHKLYMCCISLFAGLVYFKSKHFKCNMSKNAPLLNEPGHLNSNNCCPVASALFSTRCQHLPPRSANTFHQLNYAKPLQINSQSIVGHFERLNGQRFCRLCVNVALAEERLNNRSVLFWSLSTFCPEVYNHNTQSKAATSSGVHSVFKGVFSSLPAFLAPEGNIGILLC